MRFHISTKIALLNLALVVCAQAQTPPAKQSDSLIATWKTSGQWNGRFWRTLSETDKNIFLFGYSNAVDMVTIATSEEFSIQQEKSNLFWPRGLTVAEVRTSLDKIYETPENGPIGICTALYLISKRVMGIDETTIQKMIVDARARATKN